MPANEYNLVKIEHISNLLIVGGLSGAGRTTAHHAISDFGFYAIDNLPVALLENFISLTAQNPQQFTETCLLLNIDSGKTFSLLRNFLNSLGSPLPNNVKIIFLDCKDDVILKRYSETRRPHPGFDPERDSSLTDTIERERNRLFHLKEISHLNIDTSNLTVHELKNELKNFLGEMLPEEKSMKMRVNFISFGFKYGIPPDCDLLIDVRFLANPYFVPELREKTGLESPVADFVLQTRPARKFLKKYLDLLNFLIPHYCHEGKAYLNIGIGCTGGRHRSVALAAKLAKVLKADNCLVNVRHREI